MVRAFWDLGNMVAAFSGLNLNVSGFWDLSYMLAAFGGLNLYVSGSFGAIGIWLRHFGI
jgi:hypothetical protein